MIARGQKRGNAKLTVEDVLLMRALRRDGVSVPALSRRFKVSTRQVAAVVARHAWRHVE